MGNLTHFSRGALGMLFAALIAIFATTGAQAAAPAPKCGGLNEKVCTTAAAAFEKTACPKGSFFDPRKGGECWDCPSGTHRTIFPVNEGKACERRASSDFHKAKYLGKTKTPKPSGAFYDPRKGGEWWKCPSNRPRRTAYAVTDKRACATKKILGEKLSRAEFKGKVNNPRPNGAFADPRNGGEYWTCEGSNRTVFPVNSGKACEKITKAAWMKAEYKGKFGCTKGSFFDPRNGGECWSCPSAYFRNANPVTHKAACTINIGKACDSGNIDVRGKCYKKGECGKKNQRPCLIVERVPSCNKGLAEDFIANLCIPTNVAICLTAVRIIKAGKAVGKLADHAKKVIPNLDGLTKAGADAISAVSKQFSSKKNKDVFVQSMVKQVEPFASTLKEIEAIGKKAASKVKGLINTFSREKFCTMSEADRKKEITKLNMKAEQTFKKAGLDRNFLDGLFIKSAHAAASGSHFYMTYGISVAANAVIGGGATFTLATDYRGNVGAFIGIGPSLQSNVAAGASFDIGFYPKTDLDGFSGWGHSFALAGGPFKIVSAGVSVAVSEDFKELQGFGVSVGAGAGILPADFTYGAAHDWKL